MWCVGSGTVGCEGIWERSEMFVGIWTLENHLGGPKISVFAEYQAADSSRYASVIWLFIAALPMSYSC